MRLGENKGTGFEHLIQASVEEELAQRPKGEYILETCNPGVILPVMFLYFLVLNLGRYPSGDLVLIHGSVLHKSERNTSPHTRFAYTFHMIESPPYAKYDEKNWLQPTKEMPFSRILSSESGEVAVN